MECQCIVIIEERTPRDDITSTVSITLDSRLTPTLDSIIDRNTQLLFDQDNDNAYEYKASLVDKSMMINILSCIRSSGWDWATSNGYSGEGEIIKNFYFEKKIDISKMKPVVAPKRSGRKILHFGTTGTPSPRTPSPGMTEPTGNGVDAVIPNGQAPPPPEECATDANSHKQRRASSVHDTKTANIFKHLAERRKLSQGSNHPLDVSSINEAEEGHGDNAISSASTPTQNTDGARPPAPPPAPPPPPPPAPSVRSAAKPARAPGKVGDLTSMFENQLQFQRRAEPGMAKRRSSLAVGFKPGNFEPRFLSESGTASTSPPFPPSQPTSLTTLTTSRPVTERKRRPTPTQKHSILISQMRRPLEPSASFEEADAEKNKKTPCIPEEVESDLLKKLVEEEAAHIASRQEIPVSSPSSSTLSKAPPSARGASPMPTCRKSVAQDPLSPPAQPPPTPPPPSPRGPPAGQPPSHQPPLPIPPPTPKGPPVGQPPSRQPPLSTPGLIAAGDPPSLPTAPTHPPTSSPNSGPPPPPPPIPIKSTTPSPPPTSTGSQRSTHDEIASVANPLETRLSTKSIDSLRSSAESEKSMKNAAYFKQMKDDEEKQKQEKLNALSPEELEKFLAQEEANKAHENEKVTHFAKLGKTFAVGTSKLFGRGGGGRGGRGNRGK